MQNLEWYFNWSSKHRLFRNKFEILVSSIAACLDILIISEIKLDEHFPFSQFLTPGFKNPTGLDRSSSGGRIILYTREGAPFKLFID